MLRTLKTKIAGLRKSQDGVAAVEFAVILPFMLAMFLGSIEISQLIIVDRRVSNVAGTIGDLVAQSEDVITAATLTDYFDASEYIIAPFPNKTSPSSDGVLSQIVTCVKVDSSGETTVVWSRGHNGGTAHTPGAIFADMPTSISDVAHDTHLIIAETAYTYSPILGYVMKNSISLGETFVFYPRFGAVINYDPV